MSKRKKESDEKSSHSKEEENSTEIEELLRQVAASVQSSGQTFEDPSDNDLVGELMRGALQTLKGEYGNRVREVVNRRFQHYLTFMLSVLEGGEKRKSSQRPKRRRRGSSDVDTAALSSARRKSHTADVFESFIQANQEDFQKSVAAGLSNANAIAPFVPSYVWLHALRQRGTIASADTEGILKAFKGDRCGCERSHENMVTYASLFASHMQAETKIVLESRDGRLLRSLIVRGREFLALYRYRSQQNRSRRGHPQQRSRQQQFPMYVPTEADWRMGVEGLPASDRTETLQLCEKDRIAAREGSATLERSAVVSVLASFSWAAIAATLFSSASRKQTKKKGRVIGATPLVEETSRFVDTMLRDDAVAHVDLVSRLSRTIASHVALSAGDTDRVKTISPAWICTCAFIRARFDRVRNIVGARTDASDDGAWFVPFLAAMKNIRAAAKGANDQLDTMSQRLTESWLRSEVSKGLDMVPPRSFCAWFARAVRGSAPGVSRQTMVPFASLFLESPDGGSFKSDLVVDANDFSIEQLDALGDLFEGYIFQQRMATPSASDGDERVGEDAGGEVDEKEVDSDDDKDLQDANTGKPLFFIDSVGSQRTRAHAELLALGSDPNEKSGALHNAMRKQLEALGGSDGDASEEY